MDFRIEKDSLGEVKIPSKAKWGPQTQRSVLHFPIGWEKMPVEIIHAFAHLKKAAASTNKELGKLESRHAEAISRVCDEILNGSLDDEFPLSVWQTGSGTQTNMNVNEVIANRANELLLDTKIHANDHVNMGQSSNDTFPTAFHTAAVVMVENTLLPALGGLEKQLKRLSIENNEIIKVGRTHLQDAVPLTLGQEISGWHAMITEAECMIRSGLEPMRKLAIGGTAVGTGLNTHCEFGDRCAAELTKLTGTKFLSADNKFHALTSKDAAVFSHGAIKSLAANLMKIANDIRWLSSGPRCGLGELIIPENEPGSSIMPGKVNPTQCEAITMVAVQVMGNDAAIGFAASQGNFELNVFMPVIAYNYLQSVKLLSDSIQTFNEYCVKGIVPNKQRIDSYLDQTLMIVTALNPHIGYDNAAKIAQLAHAENTTLKQAALKLNLLSEEDFDRLVNPADMLAPQKN